jgi:2-isopropylmalate synthase
MTEPTPAGRIRLHRWTVTAGSNVTSRAAVVLSAGGRDWKASAEGTGAVDALYKAVDAALADTLGGHPLLIAYDVHAVEEGPDAEGRVSVRIGPPVSAKGERTEGWFTGEVSSSNTIAASVEAYVEALNAMLDAESWAGAAEAAASARGPNRGHEQAATPAELVDEAEPIDATEWFNR